MKTLRQLVFIGTVFGLLTASAQTVTWTGTTDSEFNNSSNWLGGFPSSVSDAIFTTGAGRTNVNVSGFTMIGSLTFKSGSPSYTFSGTGDARFSLALGLTVESNGASVVAFDPSVSFELTGNQTWTVDGLLTVQGALMGTSGGLIKTGGGVLTLEGDNGYAGNTTINGGTVIARNASGSATGTGAVTVSGGATLQIGTGGNTGSIGGAITNNGSLVFNRNDSLPPISSEVLAFFLHDGLISGGGTVTINQGVLGFTADNTYTGGTTINGGRLIALNATGSATGTGNVTVGPGGVLEFGRNTTFGGISGNVQLASPSAGVVFDRSDDFQYDGVISGQGTVQQSGSGTVALGGANSYQGDTYLVSGVLADAAASAFSSSSKLHFFPGGGLRVNFSETVRGLILDAPPSVDSTATIELGAGATLAINSSAGAFDDFTGAISGAGVLTKTGLGTQVLAGQSTYSGGTSVIDGTLLMRGDSSLDAGGALVSGPLGVGTLTLGNGALFGIGSASARIANAVNMGDNVTLLGGKDDNLTLELGGPVTLGGASTRLHVQGETPVLLSGDLNGPAGASLTVDDGGALVLFGTTGANIASLVADAGAISFANVSALPSTVTVGAVNGGYTGVVAGDVTVSPTSALLLSRIANPAGFKGTFGFDSDPELATIQAFAENLDFTAFTDPAFRIGSGTAAILTGTITPPTVGGKPLYAFGGAGGHLALATALTDIGGTPASVLVASPAGAEPQSVILRASNSFTGTNSLGAVTASIVVDNAAVTFDAPGSLPAGATFAFGSSGPAYIGATEAAGFTSFADFASRLAPSGSTANSILGVDSHGFYEYKIANGPDAKVPNPGKFGGSIDLHGFSSIYLGTATDMILAGPITAPANGELRLTALDDGHLTIAANLGDSVTSVVVGVAGNASDAFSDGLVELTGSNTYAGGTTLYSGTLQLNPRTLAGSEGLALGTGPLTVAAGGVSDPVLRGVEGRMAVVNGPVVLNTRLQVNQPGATPADPVMFTDGTQVLFNGTISGPGSLEVFRSITLAQPNTYAGGTVLHPGTRAVLGSGDAFGTGPLSVNGDTFLLFFQSGPVTVPNALSLHGTLNYGANGGLTFTGPVTLDRQITVQQQWGPAAGNAFTGSIGGTGSLMFTSRFGMDVQFRLSGTNTYSGGTTADGTTLIFLNPGSVPFSGQLTSRIGLNGSAGYIGVGYSGNTTTSFLNRFDRQNTNGVIGFDSANPAGPNLFTEDIDLSGFLPDVRLGSATIATLSGNITPAGTDYQFGDNGGVLIVESKLSGERRVDVKSTRNPLTLVLKGANSYTAGTNSAGSIVRFDGPSAVPAAGSFNANNGYIGMTEAVGLSLSGFFSRFASAVNGVIGLDTANPAAPRIIDDPISLVGYSTLADAYLGTSTALTLNGAVTPEGSDLRLAAVGQGSLVLNSTFAGNSLVLGAGSFLSGNATIILNAANTYTGGTSINGTHVLAGHSSAFGAGPITLVGGSGASLGASVDGLALANSLTSGGGFNFDGTHSFTFSGTIAAAELRKTGAGTVSLTGHNPGLGAAGGTVTIDAGRLVLAENDSLGGSALMIAPGAVAEFLSVAPSISGLSGSPADPTHPVAAMVKLADSATLTINGGGYFGGEITGNAALALTNSAATPNLLSLAGANTYAGGTTIGVGAMLQAASNGALSTTGAVTVAGGTLVVSKNVTLGFTAAHPLVFTSGRITGAGTITSDASLLVANGRTLAAGLLTSGATATVSQVTMPAVLSLSFNAGAMLVFGSGGEMEFRVADAAAGLGGWSRITVTGTLDVAATAAAPFNLKVSSVGADGSGAFAQGFDPGQAYTWALLTATSITGFDPTKFTIDASAFANMPVNAGFSLSVNDPSAATSLLLNYNPSAVPEPTTWALLLAGLAIVAVIGGRRRQA